MSDQSSQNVEYRGYSIVPKPVQGHDDLWHDGYQILKGDASVSSRTNTESAHSTLHAAFDSSVEFAKIEVDNLVALTG
ncbi:hypothetical protein BCF11_0669 [Collimonas sp. PA-H2]|uniref:hypothetical protein n=1 Tax=Collimonas sp. PA-H2 TaxID=1881062 RepID=UPI000BF711F0|nr:hypothetical protein [Collimonas sp. PA-H2]PFH08316.1 hypothetical protein BCF11_0669 [Collimonas sp. PA-H2]